MQGRFKGQAFVGVSYCNQNTTGKGILESLDMPVFITHPQKPVKMKEFLAVFDGFNMSKSTLNYAIQLTQAADTIRSSVAYQSSAIARQCRSLVSNATLSYTAKKGIVNVYGKLFQSNPPASVAARNKLLHYFVFRTGLSNDAN